MSKHNRERRKARKIGAELFKAGKPVPSWIVERMRRHAKRRLDK